jgi:uncharacterized protein YjbI with pentapeptide repeats
MHRSFVALLLVLLAAFGCSTPVDGTTTASTSDDTSSALRDDAPFPPRVDVPLGASREEVCAHDDGDMKAAFRAHAKGHELGHFVLEKEQRPAPEQGDRLVWTCRYCDLDGVSIEPPAEAEGQVRIEDSTMANAYVGSHPKSDWYTTLQLKNVYARGAQVESLVLVRGENVDMRCAENGWTGNDDSPRIGVLAAKDLDMAGSHAIAVQATGDLRQLRLTGAELDSFDFIGATVADARLDAVHSASDIVFERSCDWRPGACPGSNGSQCAAPQPGACDSMPDKAVWTPTRVSGAILFDGSPALHVRLDHAVLRDAAVSAKGSAGTLELVGPNTFEHVGLEGDGVRLTGDLDALRITGSMTWPVGARGLVPDSELTKMDLSGAVLTPAKGEAWPPASLVLDGLRLTHGGFADGVDLSHASLRGAKLERVHFGTATLSKMENQVAVGTRFDGASLEGARFDQQTLDGVSFAGADLRGASFALARGSADFQRAKASRLAAHTDDNDTDRALDASFEGAELGASRFDDALLQYANFRRAKLADVAFARATADWADFSGARFFRPVPGSPGISSTTLGSAAGLHGALFDGADLRGVSLAGLDLVPSGGQATSFVGAFLCGADLSATKLRGANLSGAYFDVHGNVTFPDGTVGACTGGSRAGADTSSWDGLPTSCPLRGERPTGEGGMCSDAQWTVDGGAACTPDQTRSARRNGAPCASECDCQSLFCSANGTCADGQ